MKTLLRQWFRKGLIDGYAYMLVLGEHNNFYPIYGFSDEDPVVLVKRYQLEIVNAVFYLYQDMDEQVNDMVNEIGEIND